MTAMANLWYEDWLGLREKARDKVGGGSSPRLHGKYWTHKACEFFARYSQRRTILEHLPRNPLFHSTTY